ncbi:MAG: toxin-antitoxin system, antitoxin component, Xre family protein [Gammaproteobacteria bacterium]|nr:toxin-antitoxin system, antitoxin component, Xre family protein [Gammaproteobacteria bacterium]
MTTPELLRFIRRFRQLPREQQAAVDQLVQSLNRVEQRGRPPDAFAALAHSSLREVWDNDEDAEYDRL